MQMRKRNIITSLVLLAFCVYAWFEVKDLPLISNFFPKVCIFFLAVLCIGLLIQASIMKVDHVGEEKKNLKFVKILIGAIAGYILGIFIIGFNIASGLFLWILGYVFDPLKTKKSILYSLGIAVFVVTFFYMVFGMVFNVPLPKGMILEKLG
ncbi:MAG: tripartite tricarboxylate transporter TctB family protein [Peptococcales bacterium]|jgi:hypothetical protein